MLNPIRRNDDLKPTGAVPESFVPLEEQAVPWGDGTVWLISWFSDHDGYYAGRWYDPDEIGDDESPGSVRLRDCPGPEEGVFASLDAVEAAMGEPLPAEGRAQLELQATAHPCTCRHAGASPSPPTSHTCSRTGASSPPGRRLGLRTRSTTSGTSIAADRRSTCARSIVQTWQEGEGWS
jgi:hypothetical protein